MQKVNKTLMPYSKNGFKLKSRLVMAPMTRSRAIDNLPNELMEEYYGQRAGAGLIITEGTSPTPNGLGYPRIPGIYNKNQICGWSLTTQKVHQSNSLNIPNLSTAYTPGANGYTDYPTLARSKEKALLVESN